MIDTRFDEVRKLIPALISKTNINDITTSALITEDNTLVICTYKTILYSVKLSPESPLLGPISFNVFKCMSCDNNETSNFIYNNDYEYNYIISVYNKYYFQCTNVLAFRNNIVPDPEMIKYTGIKASDGIRYLKLFGSNNKVFMVPIMSSLPSINKGDDYNINIYAEPFDLYSYCCEFVVWKKKIKRNYSIRFRILGE